MSRAKYKRESCRFLVSTTQRKKLTPLFPTRKFCSMAAFPDATDGGFTYSLLLPPTRGCRGCSPTHNLRTGTRMSVLPAHGQHRSPWHEAQRPTAAEEPSPALLAPYFSADKQHPDSISPLLTLPKATGSCWLRYQ